MGIRLFQENGSLSISPENLILYYLKKKKMSVLKISKTFVFFLRTPIEYLTRYGQGSTFKIRSQGSLSIFLKKKTKVIDIFNMDKKCFLKINIDMDPFSLNQRIPITGIKEQNCENCLCELFVILFKICLCLSKLAFLRKFSGMPDSARKWLNLI